MDDLDAWFVEDVLPLEGYLMSFLRRHWNNNDDLVDLRQEVYVRAYEAARAGRPDRLKPFLLSVARNLIIDWARRAQVVPIRSMTAADEFVPDAETLWPERLIDSRQQLSQLLQAIEQLPTRCREVVKLRRMEGCSQRETARRMGIAEHTVERQMANAMRRLADAMLAQDPTPPTLDTVASTSIYLARYHE